MDGDIGPVYIPVSDFYYDKVIFVTGATGFIGKVLIEKLLWSCRGIRKIYVLIRPKNGQTVCERFNELKLCPVFSRVQQRKPSDMDKLVPIPGDVTKNNLGLSLENLDLLMDTVSVVFHTAATVKFDETLKQAVTVNVVGTKNVVKLSKQMDHLDAFIHVSTAYCQCDRDEVSEIIYAPPYDPDAIIQCIDWMDDDLSIAITPKLLGDHPNTYTFTKALAEHVVAQEGNGLPAAIVRPSIILGCFREPFEGWVENWNGANGLVAAAGKGIFRSMLSHGHKIADLIPVDMVVNLMITAAWRAALLPSACATPVYNCCTGDQMPVTWKTFIDAAYTYMRKNPLKGALWYPDGRCNSSRIRHSLSVLSLQTIPAYVADILAMSMGAKPTMVKMQLKLRKAASCLEYFTTHQWQFSTDNVQYLLSLLSPEDQYTFMFDVQEIVWPTYLESYVLGIRTYIFNEDLGTLPACRKRLRKFRIIHRLGQFISYVMMLRAFLRSRVAPRFWYFILNILLNFARLIPFV